MSTQEEEQIVAQCFHCKKETPIKDAHKDYTENGRLRVHGACSVCEHKVSRFVKDPTRPALTDDERKEKDRKRREEKKKNQPESLKSDASKKKRAARRKIKINGVILEVLASEEPEEGDESSPKRRKLTAKEKREKLIAQLKEKSSTLEETIKELNDKLKSYEAASVQLENPSTPIEEEVMEESQ